MHAGAWRIMVGRVPIYLLDTNLDLLEDIGADAESLTVIMAEIHANRHSVEALNRIFDAYSDTIAT